jgi:hypothetical protein
MIPIIQRVPAHIRIFQTRAQYRAAFGVEPPPFDFTRPVKDWMDTRKHDDPDVEITYTGVRQDRNGNPVFDDGRVVELRPFRLFPEEAAAVNLLPEPLPPQGALTESQLAMVQRKRSWPLELKVNERVILAPGIGMIPVVDDGSAVSPGACQCGELLAIVRRIATKVGA